MRSPRFLPAAIVAVALSALLGGFFGGNVATAQDEVTQQYRIYTDALALVESEYVEAVPVERLVFSSIDGLLHTLDPHSSFFEPRDYAAMRERQSGSYAGLGVTIASIDGDITIQSIFEGSPAYKSGLRRSDVIARVEGEDMKGWTTQQAVSRLKGHKGTPVNISIRRRGYEGLIEMKVVRDEVNITTVRGAFMIDNETGYVKLAEFSETSDKELETALQDLNGKGMKRLVLDLRDNPGGLLDQAIRISNRFLPKGDLIVSQRGRVPNSDQDYHATEASEYNKLPLVVMVNRNSASASEIVSGALQDHDRALIVGETTFGKALVQSVYKVAGDAGVAVTTGRYYTPSGRLIQRPWDGSFDEYLMYSLKEQTEEKERSAADLKYTDGGRKVYGGGGIQPDKFLAGPVEGFSPTQFGRQLYARQAFAQFADQFRAQGDTRLADANKNKKEIARGFTVTDAMVSDFRKMLDTQKVKIDEAAFTKDLPFIRAMMRYDIDLALFGISEARRNLIMQDPQAQFALNQFGEAARITALAKTKAGRGLDAPR
ncbi:MAG TPA: S41 family peptidase [Vicinamibacterales bacterium]|nr:S41 family peptidase [Vicinamibacterales bacterium]